MYLYRHDGIDPLIAQRRSDPFLRARLRTGATEEWPHHQVTSALAAASDGFGVYRLSFWKTLSAATNEIKDRSSSVLQRIPEDHPSLALFEKGDDEWLEGKAYLYWATMKVNPDRPNWSPVGIQHSDIEVWSPDGKWEPMDNFAVFGAPVSGWNVFETSRGSELHCRLEVVDGSLWLMVRQRLCGGDWLYFNYPDELNRLITELKTNFEGDKPISRWAYMLEADDRIIGREVILGSEPKKAKGLNFLRFWLGGRQQSTICICPPELLSSEYIEKLYKAFGARELLWRGTDWRYTTFPE